MGSEAAEAAACPSVLLQSVIEFECCAAWSYDVITSFGTNPFI